MDTEAVYCDGLQPARRGARVMLSAKGLTLSADGGPAFQWDYGSIRLLDTTTSPLRFHREQSGTRTGEILEVMPGPFTDALRSRCPSLDGPREERNRTAFKIIGWCIAALALVGALIIYGLPALAGRAAKLVPWTTEVSLGNAIEEQVLKELGGGTPKLCGKADTSIGQRALGAMVTRLSTHAVLPGRLDVKVVDSPVQNAFALPGGKIVLMRGLIERAEGPDEVAGVLAHEMGHVANRDAMRGLIHAGGVSFVVGMLLGDFTGAGALLVTSRYLLTNRYSRDNESEADAFAIDVMTRAGADVRSLGRFLQRVASSPAERQLELLLTHPVTADRVAEIERRAPTGPVRPILSAEEWLALKTICRN